MVSTRASKAPTLPGLQDAPPRLCKILPTSSKSKPKAEPKPKHKPNVITRANGKKTKACETCICKNCSRAMPAAIPKQTLEPNLTEPPAETNGKRSRDDGEETGLYPAAKRQTLMTPTPKSRSVNYPDVLNGSRGWRTEPGRNRLATPRRNPRAGLKNLSSYQSRQAQASAQSRIARLNATGQSSDSDSGVTEMAEKGKKREAEIVESQNSPQHWGQLQQTEQQPTAGSQSSQNTHYSPPTVLETPSQPKPSFFWKAIETVASPMKMWRRSTTNSEVQQQNSTSTTGHETTLSPEHVDKQDESTPRIRRSIFSDTPSGYHTPAREMEKLEKRQLPRKKTNEEIQAKLAKEAEEIMIKNRELGFGAPTAEEVHRDTTPEPSSAAQKRKLSAVDGKVAGLQNGGFGISDEYLDQDNDVEGIDEPTLTSDHLLETPVAKKQKTASFQTPRSAMKKPAGNTPGGTLLRSQKKVLFNQNPVASIRGLTPSYGRAGHYNGSTFADLSMSFDQDSLSSIEPHQAISPTTKLNTLENERVDRTMDPKTRDPNDPDWRPSPANPRPGQFCLPDFDDDDDDMSGIQEVDTTIAAAPASPRPAHAELPSTTATVSPLDVTFNESSLQQSLSPPFVPTELALNKERMRAEKYKPKDSSRLSHVEAARSRSSSPPLSNNIAAEATFEKDKSSTVSEPTDANKENEPSPTDPNRDKCGMNEYDRIHEHDEWANSIFAGPHQTRVEAGLCSQFMADYVAANWGPEDERQSAEFWDAEFARLNAAFNEAERRGVEVEFVND